GVACIIPTVVAVCLRRLSRRLAKARSHRLHGPARQSLRQRQDRELHEDTQGRSRVSDGVRNLRGRYSRPSPLHRRGLQHSQTPLRARLSERNTRIATPSNLSKPPPETVHYQGRTPEARGAAGKLSQMPQQMQELKTANVDVVVTVSYPAAVIAKSSGIPTVIATGSGGPVAAGLLPSLAPP